MSTFETPEPISVTIDVAVGDARITASDRADTVVDVRPTNAADPADIEAAERTRVEFADGRLLVKSTKTWKQYSPFNTGGSIDLAMELPTGSHVEGDLSMGTFHGEGQLGTCRLKTAMGSIRLDHAQGPQLKTSYGNITVDHSVGDVDVTTGSGEVRMGDIQGSAVIKNSNGVTRVGDVTGDLRVKAANGDIVVERASRSVTAKTANGDIRIGEVARGVVVVETSAGELDVGIRKGSAAWLDVSSRLGRVRNGLDAADSPEPSDETVEVRARTSIGDIVIHRAVDQPTQRPN